MKDHMIHQHNLKMCHKCEKTFFGIENIKIHFEQDHCDSDDMSDISMNDSEYEDMQAELRNETEDIWGH